MSLRETQPYGHLSALPADEAARALRVRPAPGVRRARTNGLLRAANGADLTSGAVLLRQPGQMICTDRWLTDLSHLQADDEIDDAIFATLETVDVLLDAGELQRCAELLSRVNPESFPTEVLLALLSGTLPVRNLAEARSAFCGRVEKTLRDRAPDEVDALLDGLR